MKHFTVFLALLVAFGLFAADLKENEGTAIFKLKPEFRSALQKSDNRTGIASIDEKLQKLQVSSLSPKFSISPQKREECELSLIFTVQSPYPPQAVVNLLSSDPFVQYAEIVYPEVILLFPMTSIIQNLSILLLWRQNPPGIFIKVKMALNL